MVHIDAPVDAELDQHHGRSRAAFDVAVELPFSRLSLGCRPSSETRNAIPPLYFPSIHLKEVSIAHPLLFFNSASPPTSCSSFII